MRIQDIISLGSRYLQLGIVAVVLIAAIFLCYYMVSKRKNSGKPKPDIKKMALYGVFICYLIVVFGVTMLSRSGFWQNNIIQPLFYSYRDAWNDFSITEWRNIILNILMFVPFGFLLPFLSKKFQAFWKTYLAGFTFTLFIEVVQLILRRGIFELDDLMNNTVGAMIGYGCYRIALLIIAIIKKEKARIMPVICCQIPVVLTVTAFVVIFSVYANQELGNLNSNYISKLDNVQVETELELSLDEAKMMVYRSYVVDESETRQVAEELFATFGLKIDESRTDIYEDETIYYSNDGNRKSMWVRYAGKTFNYTDFDASFNEESKEKTDASEEDIRTALGEMGVDLPEDAVFETLEEQGYIFTVNKIVDGNKMYDGTVTCGYTEDGVISHLNYNVVEFEEYKDFSIISEKEAYEKLEQGMFHSQYKDENEVEVLGIELDYEMDTKGFYQPVYVFEVKLNGNETNIYIPAIK